MYDSYMPILVTDQVIEDHSISGFLLLGNEVYDITTTNITALVAQGNIVTTTYGQARLLCKLLSGDGGSVIIQLIVR